MRWLRYGAAAALLVVLLLGLGLLGFAVFRPDDASDTILALRGEAGSAQVLSSRVEDEYTIRHLSLVSEHGDELTTAWVREPRRPDPGYRVLLNYAGANTGERILELIPHRDDLVLMAVQYPFDRPRGFVAHARVPFDVRRVTHHSLAGGMVAVDWLEREAGLDAARIVLLGASLGSIFATIHGAIDRRIPEILLIHGGADLPSTLEGALASRTPEWLLPAAVRLARIPTDTFDPADYVDRIAPRRLTMIAARDDRHFPPDAVEAFFTRAQAPKSLRWTDTGHVGAGRAEIVGVVLEQVAAYLDEAPPSPLPVAGG